MLTKTIPMLSPKIPAILLLSVMLQNILFAQDKLNIKFGKVTPEDFNITSPLIDSSTNAVVIAEVGKSEFIANTNDLTFSLKFVVKSRIKIINKNGFDAATVTIPLYVRDNKEEKLSDLSAYTYNLENGKVVETKVAKSSVFTEKSSKNWIVKKFTFPALQEGSIIEYSYEVTSDFFFNLQSWTFQGQYPVLWSQYEANIPEFFKFVILSQGYQPYFINTTEKARVSYSFAERSTQQGSSFASGTGRPLVERFNVDGSIDYHKWVIKNAPPLKEEAYTTTLSNSISKIEFQLNKIAYPNTMIKNYMESWEQVARDLTIDENFGVPINKANNWLDDIVDPIIKGATTQQEKASRIYDYVRENFTCNGSGMYTTGLKDAIKNKGGSVGDINLLLIAMLRNQKIDANPVILSERDHGVAHEFYPLMNRYNYVIAKVSINNTIFYLDASERYLAFGNLPAQVYNGQAREITDDLSTPVYFRADSLTEFNSTNVFISNIDKGPLEGNLKHTYGLYESLELRNSMIKTSPDEFKKSLKQKYAEDIVIDNIEIDSLKLLNQPVGVKYSVKINSFNEDDIVYFNPMLAMSVKKNPFTAAERFYPVEMPYKVYDIYTLSMEIPKGYSIDELPKSVRLKFNEDEGMFEYLIEADKEYINMRCKVVLNKATYTNEDYQPLRDFYAFIVKKEAEQIVFKKIK